ncbi:type II toxin-antitoxin system HicB family antitoxin [bacterium]|nr:type II toxin-antitoxin system HicB family antitoxin [bacterium]MCI0566154.1 type II toxin-antitoxin system HicB family antitoxin [bacterium]MCI0679830.1 type II toxin-antitoxin system HicB family antitoxin [bacterium]
MITYTVELEPQEEGGYTVTVPALPGCISEGDTLEEALTNIEDAIGGYLHVLAKNNRKIPLEYSEFRKVQVFKKRRKIPLKRVRKAYV